MRDVDSMTIRALEGLDANAANQAAIDLIQNSFDLTAKFDQAAAINNRFALDKLKTARTTETAAFKADADFRQKLIQQRNDLTLQLLDAQTKERQQVQSGASDAEIALTQKNETALQSQVKSINDTLNSTPPSISDASLASTASTTINDTDRPQHATLDTLPKDFKDALTNLIKQPTFPPAIAMDNVIDLLHQRIAREFSVIYDDLMRDSDKYDVYLVQFDTSINPKLKAQDRAVHVELTFDKCSDSETSTPLAYELYPSAAAYNIMHGFNQTTHTGITGIVQTIFGWGLQASFQHDHSSLRSGLSQSIYASGFGAGQCKFGWDFAPAPNESRLAPGLRTTYAILRVPKGTSSPLVSDLHVDWLKRDRHYPGWNPLHWFRCDKGDTASENVRVELPDVHRLQLAHISYVPAETGEKGSGEDSGASTKPAPSPAKPSGTDAASSGSSGAAAPAPTPRPAVVQVAFRRPIDPNLIVTANDQILKRVRDVRGRGLYSDSTAATALHLAGNAAEIEDLATSRFGLLESDKLAEDTWFQADSHTILLNISKKTAGTDHFPVIRIVDPSSGSNGSELTALAREADTVRIGEWFFTQPATLTSSSFQPLFTKPYDPGPFRVFIQKVIKPSAGKLTTLELRLVSYATTRGTHRPIYLHDQAQVVLEADANDGFTRYALPDSFDPGLYPDPARLASAKKDQAFTLQPNWAMECRQDRGALVCDVPLRSMRLFCNASQTREAARKLSEDESIPLSDARLTLNCLSNFKVWIDEAPYYGRPGIWGDADLSLESPVSAASAAASPNSPASGNQNHSESRGTATPRRSTFLSEVAFRDSPAQQQDEDTKASGKDNRSGDKNCKEPTLDCLTPEYQQLIPRGNYEITVRPRRGFNMDATQSGEAISDQKAAWGKYEWLVQIEVIDFKDLADYEIPELEQPNLLGTVLQHYENINKNQPRAKTEAEKKNLTAFFQTPNTNNAQAAKMCSAEGDPLSAFAVCFARHRIQFAVPFVFYAFLPDILHIERRGIPGSRVELPNLRTQLIPRNLQILQLDKNIYQFQGDHLKAVTSVLVMPQKASKTAPNLLRPLATSANAVDVVVPEELCSKDAPCGAKLGIGGGYFPDTFIDLTKTDESGHEVPQTLPDIAPAKPKVAPSVPETPEKKPPEKKPPATKPPEKKPPDTKPPEKKPPDAKPPEQKPPDTKPAEKKPPDTKPPKKKPPETGGKKPGGKTGATTPTSHPKKKPPTASPTATPPANKQ